MAQVVFGGEDIESYLTAADREAIAAASDLYARACPVFARLEAARGGTGRDGGSSAAAISSPAFVDEAAARAELVSIYDEMGARFKAICAAEPRLKVYPFCTPDRAHAEASRLIAKLRREDTDRHEFVYYIQRAYELLFNLSFGDPYGTEKGHIIVRTPVTSPERAYAVHKIPNVDARVRNTVMCVLLRGALLPSMIMSKEIQEFSSDGYLTPFALFRIRRDETRSKADMRYILDLDRSYFRAADLDGKDLVFADPMNATGRSLIAVIGHLKALGVRPRSIRAVNVIAALPGALACVRAVPELELDTLWLDGVLNAQAYICPGLGDAGDRINGADSHDSPRDIIRLIADYGSGISGLYRDQISIIERTVLQDRRS